MNYISAVYAIIAIVMTSDWFFRARMSYQGQRRDGVDIVVEDARDVQSHH